MDGAGDGAGPRDPAGCLITIEGVEGAGKSTQVGRLAAWLGELGVPVVTTAEPDGTPLGLGVRRVLTEVAGLDPLAECLLFVAARAAHVRGVIRPALDRGAVVVCDRYGDSTVAYQGYGRGLDLEVIAGLNRLATDGLQPTLTIVLDVDVSEGLRRVHRRREAAGAPSRVDLDLDPFEQLGTDFHERVRKGYRAIQEREPGRVTLIEAKAPVEHVAVRIRDLVGARLGLGTAR